MNWFEYSLVNAFVEVGSLILPCRMISVVQEARRKRIVHRSVVVVESIRTEADVRWSRLQAGVGQKARINRILERFEIVRTRYVCCS